jgi:hypothetical protein
MENLPSYEELVHHSRNENLPSYEELVHHSRNSIMILTFSAGLLIRRSFRRALDEFIWNEKEIRYQESKGFLCSIFEVEGPSDCILCIKKELERWGG